MSRYFVYTLLLFVFGYGYCKLQTVWFDQSLDPVQVATRLVFVLFIGLMSIAFAIASIRR